ncbi:hypothetical protein BUALT_Bualt04G0091000 [Buddleja alternifolia]|uniref:Bet v I/Major latex protein domain-containing protein n=1 Tax=Buddleja alternifolia TaxID=168488 RepID=A0AAV6XTZ0_9LAMI|nr:hypothetical protein BUALT_Bualt04G0091000 [Buddleja alternifolia]
MAQIDTLVASTEISSPADKLYEFFRNDMSELVNIIPGSFKSAELIQGGEGSVGSVKLWTYDLDLNMSKPDINKNSAERGISLSVKLETEVINDVERSITFKAIEGDVLLLYKNYKFTIDVSDGSVQWTIQYEKAFLLAPPPDAYAAFGIMTSKLVDLYLLSH